MVIGLSLLAGGLGLVVSFLVERALRRRGAEGPPIRPWLLGLLALVLAWVIALIGLLEVVGTSPTGRPRTLFLMPSAQKEFFPFLEREFPVLARKYRERFAHSAYLRDGYAAMIRERVKKVRARHGLASAPVDYRPETAPEEAQLALPL